MNFPSIRRLPDFLVVLCMLALVACDRADESIDQPVADQTAEIAESPADTAETAAEVTDVESSVTETEGISDDIEETEEIELKEAEQPATGAARTDWQYQEGEDYRRLTTSQGTSSAPDKIEVAEVFWYGCPHCYNFDPVLSDWEEQLPADVAFVRIPVIWNPTNQAHARLMYTAEALGVLDKIHPAVFEAIHQKGDMLTDEDGIVELFESVGVDKEAFLDAYQSFGVSSAVKRAENLTRRYGIRSVPVLVINGKYVTDSPNIKTFGDMLNVTNELVERERTGS